MSKKVRAVFLVVVATAIAYYVTTVWRDIANWRTVEVYLFAEHSLSLLLLVVIAVCLVRSWGRKQRVLREEEREARINEMLAGEKLFAAVFVVAGVGLTLIFPPNNYQDEIYRPFWSIPEDFVDTQDLIARLVIFAAVGGLLYIAGYVALSRGKRRKRRHKQG